MPRKKAKVVGFNPTDADALLQMLEAAGGQTLSRNSRPYPIGWKWGMTKSTGLGANTKGMVFMQRPTATGWESFAEVEAWNRGSAIAANTLCILVSIDGRWCAFEVCP
jgi:hypothetical protein